MFIVAALLCRFGSSDPDDWLVGGHDQLPTLEAGTLAGVPTLTLTNGLISRVFAMPATRSLEELHPAAPSAACPNPGGRTVKHSTAPFAPYPYYGLPCARISDCGQCATDNTCICSAAGPCSKQSQQPCCRPISCPSVANVSGFATISLAREGKMGYQQGTSPQMLRASSPEAIVQLGNATYNVGGLVGQADYAFLNASLLSRWTADPGAFVYSAHRLISTTQKRYEWTPGARHSDSTLIWPPKGVALEIDFVPPKGAPPDVAATLITIVYEMYASLPLYSKWVRISTSSGSSQIVTVNNLSTEVLYVTNEAMGYWAHGTNGALTSASNSGRIHMQSEMSRGGDTTFVESDDRCHTCTQGNGQIVLRSAYPLGPGAEIGGGGKRQEEQAEHGRERARAGKAFHGPTFESMRTYVLLHDSDDMERQGLGLRRMYRTLAPQVTENPIFMHLTDTTPEGIRSAVDQCAAVGFEMIIMSFGSGLNMESTDDKYIDSVRASVAYAHSKGIEIGGYNLMSSSRTVAKGGNCVGPEGKPAGASCLASDWSDDYFATIKHFINRTGFDMIETDGPFEGAKCYSTTHSHHKNHLDSVWTQYERNMDFYKWCRERGMYIHAPDPYYLRGINKDGMGYVETNWNLPLWEQIHLARQNVYDGTVTKVPSQGWMFVPIVQYHGGWPECCIEPVGFMSGPWEWYLFTYFGTGVSPCYRGTRLYDEKVPASKALVQKYTPW
mgnify:CR=1 FL=1